MCHTWQKQNHYPSLSLEQIDKIFSDPLLSGHIEIVNLTGGEPTLRRDFAGVIEVLLNRCKNLRRIDIPTNGINTDEVVDKIEQALTLTLPTDVKIAVTVSLDGIGEVHNRIRRVIDAFDKSQKTIFEMLELTRLWSNLLFGINTTISRLNFDRLHEVKEFGLKNGVGINYTFGAISEVGVESIKMQNEFALRDDQKYKVIDFIEGLVKERRIYERYAYFMLQHLKTKRRKPICAFRSKKSFLVEPDGSVYACGNFKDFYIGNVLKEPFSIIWKNVRKIKRSKWKRCFSCESNCYIDEVIRG